MWAPTPTMDVIFCSVTTHVRLQIWFPQRVLIRASDVRNAPARLAVSSRINLMVSFTRTDVGKCCSFLFPWIEDAHIMLRLSCLACAVASPSAVIRMRYNLGARAAAYPPDTMCKWQAVQLRRRKPHRGNLQQIPNEAQISVRAGSTGAG